MVKQTEEEKTFQQKEKERKDREEYYRTIDKCAESGKDFVIHNGNAEHAAYLLTKFFGKAEKRVRIFTGALFGGVFDNEKLVQAACDFLSDNANRKIVVAFQDGDDKTTQVLSKKFVQELAALPDNAGTLEIYSVSDKAPLDNQINHFAVMDTSAFRFELDHEKKSAVANFGDSMNSTKLQVFFDKLVDEYSVPVPIPAQ